MKTGDKVKISSNSPFSPQIEMTDDEWGSIFSMTLGVEPPIIVDWPNGYRNSYFESDLILKEPK